MVDLRRQATSRAIIKADAVILAEPIVNITSTINTKTNKTEFTILVRGYPAT